MIMQLICLQGGRVGWSTIDGEIILCSNPVMATFCALGKETEWQFFLVISMHCANNTSNFNQV